MTRIIYKTPDGYYRIIEQDDLDASLESLKGDSFKPELHPDILEEQLLREEKAFEKLVEIEGVYGYILEKWNPTPDKGWESVDSCWGFVGMYDHDRKEFNHYIVDELKNQIGRDV